MAHKGWKGFLVVGSWMLPILFSVYYIYVGIISSNSGMAFWAGCTLFWIINSWVTTHLSLTWQRIATAAIAYIQSMPNQEFLKIESGHIILKNKDEEDKSKNT